ncbi:MAG: DUF5666 domain-containing protein, partial [Acidobacteria bacterium]|nr:DUF5666 domain-containing protein [Acidobacteriota bacterium]
MRQCKAVMLPLALLALSACQGGPRGGSGNPIPPPNTGPVTLTVIDTPPTGVTVLSFEITVVRAVLQPGNVVLLDSPATMEMRRLEVDAGLLATADVPVGAYPGMNLTLASPRLTVFNQSGAAIGGCPNNTICELTSSATSTLSFSSSPFPLTVAAGTPQALQVDINVSSIIQSDLSVNLSVAQGVTVAALPGGGALVELEDIVGAVTAVRTANSEFDLRPTPDGRILSFRADSATRFDGFDDPGGINCPPNNFSCISTGQVLEVDARIMAGGSVVAKGIQGLDNDADEEVEGAVLSVAGAPSQVELVLLQEASNAPGLEVGDRTAVRLLPTTRFRIDDDGFTLSPADFDGASDLAIGQSVQVERRSAVSTGPPPSFDTDSVVLKDLRVTATVQTVTPANNEFVLTGLPAFLGVTTLQVRIEPGRTEFENVPGSVLTGLSAGNVVSVRGLLF